MEGAGRFVHLYWSLSVLLASLETDLLQPMEKKKEEKEKKTSLRAADGDGTLTMAYKLGHFGVWRMTLSAVCCVDWPDIKLGQQSTTSLLFVFKRTCSEKKSSCSFILLLCLNGLEGLVKPL